ncbi:MAG: glycosyltransferase family 4 protein [Candidatus Gastranaerophilales bacterium]|nr:glycosyltransferase family 4 protein [Candidatus Gastranaerophilales bacterium]
MRIAQVAPLWECVPPKAYGGTELVVYILCEEYARRGFDVTLFAAGTSTTSAALEPIIKTPMREQNIKYPIYHELQSISKVLEKWEEFDIIHNHIGFQFLPFAGLINIPIVTTLHGAFIVKEEIEFYNSYKKNPLVSISDSQRTGAPGLNYVSTVYNGIQVEKYPFEPQYNSDKPYLAFLGRFSEEKGPHLAIKLAKETGWKLIMAGKIDIADRAFYEREVKPQIDNKQIIYIGELGHEAKCELLKGAYATVHPVTWPEPFGLVMAESMACGTPLLALKNGSIPEVISNGKTGYIENNINDLIKRVKDIEKIDRQACRKHVEKNFSAQKMADGYLSVYKKLMGQNIIDISIDSDIPASLNLGEK